MIDRKDFSLAGRIVKAHGLKGELVTSWRTDLPEPLDMLMVDMEGLLVPFFVTEVRGYGDSDALVTLKGVRTEKEALQVIGRDFYLPKGGGEDMYTYEDMVGFRVEYNGAILGEVTDVDDQTENILLIVDTDRGQLLLPASEDYVLELDPENRVLVMDFPEELLTING